MKLYWCERTRAVRAVWMMEELGVPYERVRIDIRDEKSRANPAFRAASPMGKVPALEDGTVRIWDSGAICAYLADQYPAAKLAPAIGSPERGAYLMWLMYTNSVIEPAMGEKFGGLKPNTVSYGWGSWDQMLATLRTAVERGPWILGERFSAVDVYVGSQIQYAIMTKALEPTGVFKEYADRIAARPALQRVLAGAKQ